MTVLGAVWVVRRFGPVGGMERYVWETAQALSAIGVTIEVVCEALHAPPPAGIRVHVLGTIAPRPRWLSLMRFSRRVRRWLQANPRPGFIVHSHERLGVHDVTTFHGPPFSTILEREWWRRVSIRVAAQLWLERREVCGQAVRAVVPNSGLIAERLSHYYPCAQARLVAPIVPAVVPGPRRLTRSVPAGGGTVGFVGREWKRKGLDIALRIATGMQRVRPGLRVIVAGPEARDIEHLTQGYPGELQVTGWVDSANLYAEMDLLIHPARAEPYGMVVAEAMAAGVPVVVSDACGIAPEIGEKSGSVVPVGAPIATWIAACEAQLARTTPVPVYSRRWAQVASEYQSLYDTLRAR